LKNVFSLGMIFLLLIPTFLIIQVKAIESEAITIKEDGSIDPPTASIRRDGNIYTLINDIISKSHGIIVKRSNIIIDGARRTIKGPKGYFGIYLSQVNNVMIKNINIRSFTIGIYLCDSSNNIIFENNIEENGEGIRLQDSSNNIIYHNNFTNNRQQIFIQSSINIWDNGYPSGGNYWSDYKGIDLKNGPKQDQPGSDGIGDIPYIIDENNIDRYPLINT